VPSRPSSKDPAHHPQTAEKQRKYYALLKDQDPDANGRIILKWIFRKWEGVVGNEWSWLRIGTGGGHL